MKPIKPLYVLIIAIVVAAAGFYGGVWYQKHQLQASFANGANGAGGQFSGRFGNGGGRGGFGGANGMRPVSGDIVSQDSNSITVKLSDGSTKIVDLTGQTMISKTSTGSTSDLKTGEHVTAIGTANSDGSVTAQNVLLGNGNMMFRRQGGQGGGQPAPTGGNGGNSNY